MKRLLLLMLFCIAAGPKAPEGFSVVKVSPAETSFPMFAALDDAGRLFVTESSGLDLYQELQKQTRKCRVRMLEDRDGDGVYERSTVFKDQLVFPMGVACRDGKVYVPDPPDLLVLEDKDGDSVADKQTKILTGFGHTDNGSLHGVTFGPDGFLYMTTGNPDGYKLKRPDGSTLSGESGALIRCNPDGSNPQMICRGFENLVEIVFMPNGQIVGTDNWFQRPTGGKRDALVQLLPGGLYPLHLRDKGTPQVVSGEPLSAITMFPAVALSGLVRYEGAAFGKEYRDNLFSAQHNARCVGRHVISLGRAGTLTSEDSQFVTSDDPDFHPADVLEDVDGSLLVIDTGGWYVQHCPTGKIRNSRAAGGIYRVKFDGAKTIDDPRGRKIDWERTASAELVKLLGDGRTAVSRRAQEVLISRANEAVEAIAQGLNFGDSRKSPPAVWALARIGTEDALAVLRKSQEHPHTSFEISLTARALASTGDKKSATALEAGMNCVPPAKLGCVEALAVCGRRESLPVLWKAFAQDPFDQKFEVVPDSVSRFLEHGLINALYRLGTADDFREALSNENARVQRAALILLDQTTAGGLKAEELIPRLSAANADLRATAQRLLKNHPDWSKQALVYFQQAWNDQALSADARAALCDTLAAFSNNPKVAAWLGEALATTDHPGQKFLLLQTLSRIPPPANFDTWIAPLRDCLSKPELAPTALAVISSLNSPNFDGDLQKLISSGELPDATRLAGIRIGIGRHPNLDDPTFTLLLNQFNPTAPPSAHFLAAEIASRSKLSDGQFLQLLEKLNKDRLVSPELLLPLLARAANEKNADALIAYLRRSIDAGYRPAPEKVDALLKTVSPKGDDLLALLKEHQQNQSKRLQELEPVLRGGNPAAGRKLFFGTKVACSTCHRVGDEGGQVGPDLTKVGAIRSGRDILESIVFPSSTIAQGYDNYIITLKNGEQLTGLMADKTDEAVTIRDSSAAARIVRNSDIKSSRRDTSSIMPQGLDTLLSRQEFADLIAFLQSLR